MTKSPNPVNNNKFFFQWYKVWRSAVHTKGTDMKIRNQVQVLAFTILKISENLLLSKFE